jgi:nucleolar protein 9
MRSVFGHERLAASTVAKDTPRNLKELAKRMVEILRTELSDNEIRALASDKVASPTLQIMVRVESENGEADRAGSLMDRALRGLITRLG